MDEIKRLEKLIRKMRRHGVAAEFISELETMGRNLLNITQQKEADLAAAFIPSATEPQPSRNKVERVVAQRRVEDFVGTIDRVQDRALGAMLGLAVGEALGITTDGSTRDSYREVNEMWGGGRTFDLKRGEWAGSTASARALMESLARCGSFDERDFMNRLCGWEEHGHYSCTGECLGMDNSTRQALAKYRATNDPIAGDRHDSNVSCGSLVRVAPIAVRHWNEREVLLDVAERQSRTTHGGPFQIEVCRALADMIARTINGGGRETMATHLVPGAPSIEGFLASRWHKKKREDISSDDNVFSALSAALWCVGDEGSFEQAVLRAANLGEAASIVTAITGQLAGSLYGASRIPLSWLELLVHRDVITAETEALFQLSRQSAQRPVR